MKLKTLFYSIFLILGVGMFIPEVSNAADTLKPFVRATSLSPNDTTSGNVQIHIIAGDDDSGVQSITLPNSSVVNRSYAFYTVTQNGKYLFTVRDVSGNTYTHPIVVSNIDKTRPTISHVTLIEQLNNTYSVIVDADDNVEIQTVKLNTNQLLTKPVNEKYYIADNLTVAPTSVTAIDSVGNPSTATTFLDIPTKTAEAGYSEGKIMKEDVTFTISGTQKLGYTIGLKNYLCSSTPCSFNLVKNDEITITNFNSTKKSQKVFKVTNINKSPNYLTLSATRTSSRINLSWNLSLTNSVAHCESNTTGVTTASAPGTSFSFNAPNESFQCDVTGSYQGYPIESNSITVPPIYSTTINETNPNDSYYRENFSQVYVEYNLLGETYYLNTGHADNISTMVPIPNSLR